MEATVHTRKHASASVPFLDLAPQQAEVAGEVLPAWRSIFDRSAFVGGPEVEAFEEEYADYIGVRHCVSLANGTDALELAYRAVGVRPGDEVIMPANTFVATAEAASRLGAKPVLVDVEDDSLLINPDAVEAAVTPQTRAIVPVHLYGQTAPMDALVALAERHGVPIVEDAAQAQGASSTAGRAGTFGAATATSFYPGKNLGAAGDAGAVLTDDQGIATTIRTLASHGSRIKYVHELVGVNSRLDAIQAVLLRAKLRRLEAWNAARRQAAARYADLLSDVQGLRLPRSQPGNNDVWHLYVVRVEERDHVVRVLREHGVEALIHYPTPVHLTEAYGHLGYARGAFPVAEAAADRILSLPIFPHLTPDQQQQVAEALTVAVR